MAMHNFNMTVCTLCIDINTYSTHKHSFQTSQNYRNEIKKT